MPRKKEGNFYEKVLSGEIEVEKVYNSDNVLAFYHTKPKYKTHIILLPKVFIKDFIHVLEETKDIVWELFSVARYLAKTMESEKEGVRFYTDGGKFQKDPYFHFHLVAGKKLK